MRHATPQKLLSSTAAQKKLLKLFQRGAAARVACHEGIVLGEEGTQVVVVVVVVVAFIAREGLRVSLGVGESAAAGFHYEHVGGACEAEGAGRDCRGVVPQCELVAAQASARRGMYGFLRFRDFGVPLL